MDKLFSLILLIIGATGLSIIAETAHIKQNKTAQQVIRRIKKDIYVKDNPCERVVVRRQPHWRKGLRKSDIQCDMLINDMFYRDEIERNDEECQLFQGDDTVTHGQNARPEEFPHMAAVGYRYGNEGQWAFNCGGSLISSRFVLTAAHCVVASGRGDPAHDTDPRPKIVRLGEINVNERTLGLRQVDVNISNVFTHPNYEYPKKYYDIALLELEKDVEFNRNIQPACLWNQENYTMLGTKAVVTGWGNLGANSNKRSPVLQAATIDILDIETCDGLLQELVSRRWYGIHDDQICAGTLAGGADTCAGDSGGPLQVKIPLPLTTQGMVSYVIGFTSFGTGCGFQNKPGLYASVYKALDWIESVVWPV